MDLRIRKYLSKAQTNKDLVSLKKAYDLIRVSDLTVSDCGYNHYEFCLLCAEQSLQLGCRNIAQDCIMMFMNGKPPANQLLGRAYLCQAQLVSQHNTTKVKDLDKAVMWYLKAIEFAKVKPRYHFLVYNASQLYLQTVRLFLRPGQRQHLVSSLTQVVKALEEIQEPDHKWRAELMLQLIVCLCDAGKEQEAADFAKVTSDFIKSHKVEVYPRLFTIQVRHNLIDESDMLNIKNPKLLMIYKIEKLKRMVEANKMKKDDFVTLKETLLLLTSDSQNCSPSPKAQSSSPPPESQSFSPLPKAQSSSPSLEAQSSSPPPEAQSSSPPPESQSFSPPPKAQTSSPPPESQSFSPLPKAQSSSPSLEAQSSSPPPEAQSSSPPPESQSFSPPPKAQTSSPPPESQSFSPPSKAQSSSPTPKAHSSSSPPEAQISSPPLESQSFSPPPKAQSSSPQPEVQSSSPLLDPKSSSPPPKAQSSGPQHDVQNSIPLLDPRSSSPLPEAQSSSPPPNAQSSGPQHDVQSSSPPLDPKSSSSPPEVQSSSSPSDPQSSSPPPKTQSYGPQHDVQSSSPPLDPKSSSSPPEVQSSSPPPESQSSSPPPDHQSSSPPANIDSSGPVLDHSSYISLTDRIDFLLELAFLSLQLEQHQVMSDCLMWLRNTDLTVRQRIMMECLQCCCDLSKQRDRIENHPRPSVELNVVRRLDALLQTALRDRDARVIQTVCVAQWNTCLPLLKPNLRKKIKKPLSSLARALEGIDSSMLDVLCEIHADLADIEEEDDRLEAAMKHVERALQLDQKGLYTEHLSFTLHLLQLRSSPHITPKRPEERAAQLIQQTRDAQGCGTNRPLLVSAGITLAPDAFRMVLDADNTMKGTEAQGHLAQLAAKAQNYTACVQKVEGHLIGLDKNSDDRERVKLWALLAKTAWKYEVYDVCRAACRFCLLYDDGRWKNSRKERPVKRKRTQEKTETDVLRLLAEVNFINAEVTVLKLHSEGVELNASPVPPEDKLSPEDDVHWTLYSDWIKDLSAYATANFLRGAELGAELNEAWLVANVAVKLWSYNRWLLASKGHRLLLPTYSRLLEFHRQTGGAGDVDSLVLLCDAVAQGLITPAHADQEPDDNEKKVTQLPDKKAKKGRGKAVEKSSSANGLQFDAMEDAKKALEVCDYALLMSNGNTEPVSIDVRKQLISTWVKVKLLLQQQIGQELNISDQSQNKAVTAMSRVLVGVEMLHCNTNTKLMKFTVPSLSVLVQMAQDCQWSSSIVELYVWTQLALFAHQTLDHDIIMTCTHNALQMEQTAINSLNMSPYALFDVHSVQEMLCSAACVRGLSLIHEVSVVDSSRYMTGLEALQSSVSYAEQTGTWCLCMRAVCYYWNACVPLLNTRQNRGQLKKTLELILQAVRNIYTKHVTGTQSKMVSKVKRTRALIHPPDFTSFGISGNDLKVWSSMYIALFHVFADDENLRRGLQVLDEAIKVMPPSTHRLVVFKQRVLVKAQLGESIVLDMKQISDEDELMCSRLWHRVALCVKNKQQKLMCYQNAITALKDPSYQWQKVELLLEFGEWLYFTHFPETDARLQIDWAIDTLMFTKTDSKLTSDAVDADEVNPHGLKMNTVESGVCLYDVREIRRLEGLIRAHTMLALMEERSSPKHWQYLLMAFSFTRHIWKVSIETAQEVMKEKLRNRSAAAISSSSRKDKGRPDEKKLKQSSTVEVKPRDEAPEVCLPISPEQWAQFECPEEVRQVFCYDSGPYSINSANICMQSRTLFYLDVLVRELESAGLIPLTFVPLHLAEVIAHDLIQNKNQSGLYRLRIIKNCYELGFKSPYCERLQSFTQFSEEEQTHGRKTIITQRNKSQSDSNLRDETSVDEGDVNRSRLGVCDVCLEKADICLTMNLHESTKVLLTRVQLLAEEQGDQRSLAKSLQLQAVLANQEQRYSDALVLLQQAQELGGEETFWYELIQTLLTAVAGRGVPDAHHQVCEITDQACRSFRSVLEQRQNRAGVLCFFIASLETRCAVLRRHLLCPDGPASPLSDSTLVMMTSVCVTLKHTASTLLQLGYRTCTADVTLEHANTLRILSVQTVNEEEKQRHLLDAFYLIQSAVSLHEDVVFTVLNLLPPHQSGWYDLPVMRACVRLRLAFADLALMMLEIQSAEEKRRAITRDMMTSEERAVEEFIRSSSHLTDLQTEWVGVGQSLSQVILTHLTAVNSLSINCMETRARSLAMMGRCLRYLAHQQDPLYSSTLWNEPITDNHSVKRTQSEEEKEEEHKTQRKQNYTDNKHSAELQNRRKAAQYLLAQSSEMLVQSVTLSLQHNLLQLIPGVCSDLLECHGQFDTSTSGQYLALLQSSVWCNEMSSGQHAVNSDVSESDLRRNLIFSSDHRSSAVLAAVRQEHAGLFQVRSHPTINPNHMRILSEMPPNMKIFLLQHSDDGSVLYGGFYEKVKTAETPKGKSVNSIGGLICSKVVKVSVQHSDLLQLHKHLQDYKLVDVRTNSHQTSDDVCRETEHTDEDVDSVFRSLINAMEDYLHPVLSQFNFSCLRVCSSSVRVAPDKPQSETDESLVILADRMLSDLPLESLSALQVNGIGRVSRDFSLQVLHERLQTDEAVRV
ncbi:cilia- and flagella-associated protein 46 [Paramisgurnus dabryanus]|uniref:cilia- and flagella-associated protein 46 n=1 Tax=Paramisgurnus dabryanus TaxID=90735 RepID=UPI0031F424A7